jgi:hypothetical protein
MPVFVAIATILAWILLQRSGFRPMSTGTDTAAL